VLRPRADNVAVPPAKLQRLLQDALAHHRAGRLAQADALYVQVIKAAPLNFDAVQLSGVIALQQGRYPAALTLLTRALKLNPRSDVCLMRLGIVLNAMGRFDEAEQRLRASLALASSLNETWFHLAAALRGLGRPTEAIAAYEQALQLKPDYAEAHDRLGALLADNRGYAAAEPHFRRAVELQPALASAWSNLGVCLTNLGRISDALACFDRALSLEPRQAHAHAGRGLALEHCYRLHEAAEAYGRAVAENPAQYDAASSRLLVLHYLPEVSREQLFAEHLAFGRSAAVAAVAAVAKAPPPASRPRPAGAPLRVAIVSPDLRAHSVAYFLEPLLAHLDRREFDVYLYHDHVKVDAMSERLRAHAAQWRHVAGMLNDNLAETLRADAPDLLLELAGHTGFNRLPLLARRLAPVQVTYLGYPDTTGLATMDYRLTDALADPPGEADRFHTEKLVRFAPTAWAYAPPIVAPEPAPSPSAGGGPVTFGCFNNLAKINDVLLAVWGRLLTAVPGSRLLLKGHGLGQAVLQADFGRRLAAAGIAPGQVEMLERTSTLAEHLAAYGRVDIALDTFPYHGTATTCEALWMGVPVITLAGDRHAARVGVSLLTAAGHPEWIAHDWEDYLARAVALAGDPQKLAEGRTGLREDLRRSPLLDHAGQAARFGAALRAMWAER
jgi:predicted O-linked N-acetylglucosamine transferase (SPINDLY family)